MHLDTKSIYFWIIMRSIGLNIEDEIAKYLDYPAPDSVRWYVQMFTYIEAVKSLKCRRMDHYES